MMTKATRALRCFAPILGCLLLTGCGSDDDLARVKGKVTLNGQPLEGAVVKFQPTAPGGSASFGTTDADGRYELMSTFNTPGAIPGEHVVSIGTGGTDFDEEGYEIERQERVPAEYNSQTELKRTVEPGTNTIDFDL